MKKVLPFTAVTEAATGLAFLVLPALMARLLFNAELTGVGGLIARVGGIALVSLGIACWPGWGSTSNTAPALRAMLFYNSLVTLYFLWIGIDGKWVGPLLWPAVGFHAVMAILLGRAWLTRQKAGNKPAGE